MGEYTEQMMRLASHWFAIADKRFDSYDHPLWRRPLSAAIFTAEHGLERSYDRSITKYEDMLIGHLLNAAKIWYYERYGEENCQPENGAIAGAVLFKRIPVSLSIPLIARKATDDDDHVLVKFLTTIDEGENPLSFLSKKVPFDTLTHTSQNIFRNKIIFIVSATRKICTSAKVVNISDEKRRNMCHSAVERFDLGATLLTQNSPRARGMAIWEFFFAIEILLKTFIFQKGEIPEQSHSLNDLRNTAIRLGLKFTLSRLSEMPSTKHAIQHRYAHKGATTSEAMKVYEAALDVGAEIISAVDTVFNGENPAIKLVKNPGWLFPPV